MWNKTLLKVRDMQIKTLRNYFSSIRLENIQKLDKSHMVGRIGKYITYDVVLFRVIPWIGYII